MAQHSLSAKRSALSDDKKRSPLAGRTGIFEQLKADHRRIREFSKELLKVGASGTEEALTLFRQLKETVVHHARAEEAVFYDYLRAKSAELDDERLHRDVMEGYEEHHLAESLMREIEETPIDSERWFAKVKVLTELLRHHIEEEEEQMFKGAHTEIDRHQSQDMAEDFQRRKEALAENVTEKEWSEAAVDAEIVKH